MNFDKNIAKVQKQVDAQKRGGVRTYAATVLAVLLMGTLAFAGGIGQGMWGRGGGSSGTSFTAAMAQAASGWSSNGTTTTTTTLTAHSSAVVGFKVDSGKYISFDSGNNVVVRGDSSGLEIDAVTIRGSGDAVRDIGLIGTRWRDAFIARSLIVGGTLTLSGTAPTITSACTSPTVTHGGAASFQVDVGTSCTAISTLVLALPAATNGWECNGYNKTTTTRALRQTADTTTSATMSNYIQIGGSASDFVDGDDLVISCTAR